MVLCGSGSATHKSKQTYGTVPDHGKRELQKWGCAGADFVSPTKIFLKINGQKTETSYRGKDPDFGIFIIHLQAVLRIRIRDWVLFDPWIRDPGSRIQDHIFKSFLTI